MSDLTELELQVTEINDRLRPIATRPVDINDPNWETLLSKCEHPLDEAGVRSSTEMLLDAMIREYQIADEDTRRAMRGLFLYVPAFCLGRDSFRDTNH